MIQSIPRAVAASLLLVSLSAAALATGEIESIITDADRERLANFDKAKQEAVAEAEAGGSAKDRATLDEVISAEHQPFADFDMTGSWDCRTIKAGGLAKLVVYSWFDCRVTDDGSGWKLEKLSGSQRTTGRFFTNSDTELTYLGSGSIHDEAPLPYGSGPDTDQAGYTYRTGEEEWHIAFPSPRYESKLDILQFRR